MTAETDEFLALDYLECRAIKRNGIIEFVYVEPGSRREAECLAALDRLLRSNEQLSTAIRWKLASLFNPAKDAVEARQLVILRRRSGYETDHARGRDCALRLFRPALER